MGVWLFFILSSFLLSSQIYGAKFESLKSWRYWMRYFFSRAFRIIPLYLFVLTFALIVTTAGNSGEGLPATVTWPQFFSAVALKEGPGIFWTIPVEFKFYFLLPFVILFIRYCDSLVSNLGLVILLLAVGAAFLLLPARLSGNSPFEFIGVFLSGSALAVLWSHEKLRSFCEQRKRSLWWLSSLPLFLLFLLMPKIWNGLLHLEKYSQSSDLQWLMTLLWIFVVVGAISKTSVLSKILQSPLLVFFGAISYSLYLWHFVVVKPIAALSFHPLLEGWIAVLGSVFLAWLSYRFLEQPFMRVTRALNLRLKEQPHS